MKNCWPFVTTTLTESAAFMAPQQVVAAHTAFVLDPKQAARLASEPG
jgi:hypothetical protein